MNGGWTLTAAAVVLTGALLIPWIVGPYYLTAALSLWMWVALTQSWIVLSGMGGYISLGHVVFYGLGAYVSVVSWKVLPVYLTIPLAGLATGMFALCIGPPVLRVRGPYFVILTFGLAELIKFIVVNVETALGQASRLLFGTPDVSDLYFVMLGLAAASSLMAYLARRSRLGRGLLAIREDEEAAETIGIPVAKYKVFAYAVSAVIPGMVGAVMALRSTYFEPLQVFSPVVSFTVVTMAVIGGSDDARGPLVGAVFLVVLSELLWANAPQLYMIILGGLLVGFVLFAPQGIVGRMTGRRRAPG